MRTARVVDLLREQAEEFRRNKITIGTSKQFLSGGLRLPALQNPSALAETYLPVELTRISTPVLIRAETPPPIRGRGLRSRQDSPDENTAIHMSATPHTMPSLNRPVTPTALLRPVTTTGTTSLQTTPVISLPVRPPSPPWSSPSPSGSKASPLPLQKENQLRALFLKVVSKMHEEPDSAPETIIRRVLDIDTPAPDKGQAYVDSALPLVSSLCIAQHAECPHSVMDFEAAILMLDISGYSAMTAALAHLGPHILNRCVNACLSPIIDHILQTGGDIIKFAGDAMVAVWATNKLEESLQQAMASALWLQEHCGDSPIPGTDQTFRIHIGVDCGVLQSRILFSQYNSFEDFHFVSGQPLKGACMAADIAKAAQVCITGQCKALCPNAAMSASAQPDFWMLQRLRGNPTSGPVVPHYKAAHLVAGFIPPPLLQWLQQGRVLRNMEANRMLTVLFIYCNAQRDVAQWLGSVEMVLSRHQCHILQVIDDDKGIHIVAAFNVFFTYADSAERSIATALDLVGCAVGVAHGMVFCGMTGNSSACRWDVTGFACVRACRLMQHAVTLGQPAFFDVSVVNALEDPRWLEEYPGHLTLKGSSCPVKVFVPAMPASSCFQPAADEICIIHPALHAQMVAALDENESCCTFIIGGMRGSGKKWLFLSVLRNLDFYVVEHKASYKDPQLTILRTLAKWCLANQKENLGAFARRILDALRQQQVQTAYQEAMALRVQIITSGICVAFLVRHAQFLDDTSISWLGTASQPEATVCGKGKYIQCLTHYPTIGGMPMVTNCGQFHEPICLDLPPLDAEKMAHFAAHCLGARANQELMTAITVKTAGHCESVAALCTMLKEQAVMKDGELQLPGNALKAMREQCWPSISSLVTLKMFHLFDLLPYLQQGMLKVIASITAQQGITAFFPSVAEVTAALLGLDATKTMESVKQLSNTGVITECPHRCTAHSGSGAMDSAICFSPAFHDTVLETLLPEERCHVNSIAARVYNMWHPMDHPLQLLVRSRHHRIAGEAADCRRDLRAALDMLNSREFKDADEIQRKLEQDAEIVGGIRALTLPTPRRIRGSVCMAAPPEPLALSALRDFQMPLELGPIGLQVHTIARCLVDIYTIQSSYADSAAAEVRISTLQDLTEKYQASLQCLTAAMGIGHHIVSSMAHWHPATCSQGLAATIELAQGLYGHLQHLAQMTQHCMEWAARRPQLPPEPGLQPLQKEELTSSDVALSVIAISSGPHPLPEELALLMGRVREGCCAADPNLLKQQHGIFAVLRSHLSVRALLSEQGLSKSNPSSASPHSPKSRIPLSRGH